MYSKWIQSLIVALLTAFVLSAGGSATGTVIHFASLDDSHPHQVSGTLYLPEHGSAPCPAIVLVHGTTGIDSRGTFYRGPITAAGIAIFEVDFRTGIYTSATDRPPNDSFVPMAFAALKELRKLPAIDPARIGIMGFSLGGGVTLRTSMENNRKAWMGAEKGFAAHAAFYPVCKPFLARMEGKPTGAPIIIFYGTEDSYGEGTAVPELKRVFLKKFNQEVTTVEYPGATHGFNRNAPAVSYADPAAKGGRGYMTWDPEAANDSVARVVAFLRETLVSK
jgi:dienelactone hydrolase